MSLKKDRSPKEDFEKALIVLERVKNIMMKEYRERRAAVERILREKMQKWIGFQVTNFLKLTAYYFFHLPFPLPKISPTICPETMVLSWFYTLCGKICE